MDNVEREKKRMRLCTYNITFNLSFIRNKRMVI